MLIWRFGLASVSSTVPRGYYSENLTNASTTEAVVDSQRLQQRAGRAHCAGVIMVAWCGARLKATIQISVHGELCPPANQQQ